MGSNPGPREIMSASRAVALDLMLRTFMNSSEFNDMHNKNWEAIAKLIPGTTAKQCAKRYEDLQHATGRVPAVGDVSGLAAHGKPITLERSDSGLSRYVRSMLHQSDSGKSDGSRGRSRPSSGKSKDRKHSQSASSSKAANSDKGHHGNSQYSHQDENQGPNMVIHVCDEAKNLKQDFTCPRDLLVQEMKYFAEYLSVDAHRWEEVDISVHCDVQIFDWLMRYVKRHMSENKKEGAPKLEPGNVISILISSDFLKMVTLVEECIKYCHDNMSAIVATPCNMNCINDKLITRIASLFNHTEADEIKDRKDKFKSKLFCKKIEDLFDPQGTPDSKASAATLFRCSICKRLLTQDLNTKLKCLPNRMSTDREGNITYNHARDPSWDVNDFLIGLRNQVKNWREVYWRLWGSINYLKCSRCQQWFPCTELPHCQYHPEQAQFQNSVDNLAIGAVGIYPCCKQRTLRFDPTQQNTGCMVRDHVVTIQQTQVDETGTMQTVLDDLLQHRDAICVPFKRSEAERNFEVNVYSSEEYICGLSDDVGPGSGFQHSLFPDDRTVTKFMQSERGGMDRAVSPDEFSVGESDDEVGDDEIPSRGTNVRIGQKMKKSRSANKEKRVAMDASAFSVSNHKWDTTRSLRWNQDMQREEDARRMAELVSYLTKIRGPTEKQERKNKEYSGGIFCRIEAQFRSSQQVSKPSSSSTMGQVRSRTRTGMVRLT
ncbi:SANT and BTB domain regulator of class switch recombination-like [Ptychodera flava]|uniref:SANT and BTB domain regulator of class switch recombination-like n=1 Tax=Ptychodera flava TaxID=63121 RepID=UPI00396AAEBE